MAELVFPQLAVGVLAQYPLLKTRLVRTVKNALPGGELILYPDFSAGEILWQLEYSALNLQELGGMADFFTTCQGRFRKFTFIDPTGNMLANSANLLSSSWQFGNSIIVGTGAYDPFGGSTAFRLTNTAQVGQNLSQICAVPANFQYCFSAYVWSAIPSTLELFLQGASQQQSTVTAIGPDWKRIVCSAKLDDPGVSCTAGLALSAGQQVLLYGPQMKPQMAPSRFRPTFQQGGVYPNAHWSMDEFSFSADAPDLYSTVVSIETAT